MPVIFNVKCLGSSLTSGAGPAAATEAAVRGVSLRMPLLPSPRLLASHLPPAYSTQKASSCFKGMPLRKIIRSSKLLFMVLKIKLTVNRYGTLKERRASSLVFTKRIKVHQVVCRVVVSPLSARKSGSKFSPLQFPKF